MDGWLMCGAVIGVATGAKFLGTLVAARASDFGWHDSLALGALLNTRGMMEIIVANIGLECGIISPQMFTTLVIMALVTCLVAGPILDALKYLPRRGTQRPAPVG
jgi:Kef-type K+ transport system membrane component KefB